MGFKITNHHFPTTKQGMHMGFPHQHFLQPNKAIKIPIFPTKRGQHMGVKASNRQQQQIQ